MKKIISIISILAGIAIMHSCTQEDEDLSKAVQNEKTMAKERKVDGDSINHAQIIQSANDDSEVLEGDPPPKNQGQWRIKH